MKHPILLSLMSLALSAALPAMAQTAAPAGSTGQCKDGSYTSASFKMGACRGHKGVQSWFGATDAKPAKQAKSTPATAPAKPATAPMAASTPTAGTTGTCKDGTTTYAASKSGACRGHKGVQEWHGAAAATKPAASSKGIGSAGMKNTTATAPAPAAPAPAPTAAPARPAPVATTAPAPAPAARAPRAMPTPGPVAAGGGNGQVWVNMKTKVYHCQGDRWYGTSKDGQYMSESAATAAGARASRGKTCGTK
ncbi:MAG: DUF3761 domain-containing protein [Proteobacteria bacterium]|nr:DUF3761 domain-containing protein [Pseudomonadota bacterium]